MIGMIFAVTLVVEQISSTESPASYSHIKKVSWTVSSLGYSKKEFKETFLCLQ